MTDLVIVDTMPFLLYLVGSANPAFIAAHNRIENWYTENHFYLLEAMIAKAGEIVLLPHVLAEVSSYARDTNPPAKRQIQLKLQEFILKHPEIPLGSRLGVSREEFMHLGLTDAMMLAMCALSSTGVTFTLITCDRPLSNLASACGYSVIEFREAIGLST